MTIETHIPFTRETPPSAIVVEYKRYDYDEETGTPDGYVFYALTPDQNGSEMPWDDGISPYNPNDPIYQGRVDGWMRTPAAEEYRATQLVGFTTVAWPEIPEEFRDYVMGRVVPFEWHGDEPFIQGRVTVWVSA